MNKKIIGIGIIVLIIDQITKLLIDMFLMHDEVIYIVDKFFYLTRVGNIGAAFSTFEGNTLFLILASIICIILLLRLVKDFKENKRTLLSFGLIFGGIFGNLSDRLFLGYVRDFLGINIFDLNFPIFNVADSCIVLGVLILIIGIFRGDEVDEISSKRIRRTSKNR